MAGMSPRKKAMRGRFGDKGVPPVVRITLPTDGLTFDANTSYVAAVSVVDQDGANTTPNTITWTSDKDGTVGTGATPTLTLSANTHTLTVTVADGDGAGGTAYTVTDSVTITVTP